jgi:hypothetical protein
MSTNPEPILKYEQLNIKLILKIAQKTIEGKINWTRIGSRLFAPLSGGLHAEFVVPTTAPIAFLRGIGAEDWKTFYVKDETGNHLVAVDNQGLLMNALKGDVSITSATQALFNAIMNRATDELDRAIDSVDKM